MPNHLDIEKKYQAALYIRLSKEDGDKAESNSVSNQRDLIYSFLKDKSDIQVCEEKVDDGYSGVGFDRPALISMLEDVKQGKINCIIVKDLSRFGRNYIETGRYIQQIFPFMGVRFIAINDHYDSEYMDSQTDNIILPFKNLMNDSYSRDISIKVRSQIEVRQKRGDYIGSFPVYGYFRDQERKGKLVIDSVAAEVVRDIFDMRIKGYNNRRIADYLNEHGIPSPMEYKMLLNWRYTTSFKLKPQAKWSPMAVERVLKNEIYTGVMVQGKCEKVNYKVNKTVAKPQEEWIRVEGTHEAIISTEDFEIVQNLLKVDTKAKAGSSCSHLFSGLLFCGDCKEPMTRRVNRYKDISKVYFICSTRNRGKGCTRHSILEDELKEIVFQTLQVHVSVFLDVCSQLEHIQEMEVNFEEVARFDKEIERLHKEQDKYMELRVGLYEDLKSGLITETDLRNFRAIYEKQYEETKDALQKQEEMIKRLFRNGVASGVRLERFKDVMKLTTLDRDTLLCFVNRIEVFEEKKVYVEFRGKEEFHKMLVLQEYSLSKAAKRI